MTNTDTKKKTTKEEIEAIKDDCAILHALIDEQNGTIRAMRAQIQQMCSVIYPNQKPTEPRQRFG